MFVYASDVISEDYILCDCSFVDFDSLYNLIMRLSVFREVRSTTAYQ